MEVDELSVVPTASGPRCADWAREVGVDPVGTAAHARGWLLVDWPLPWPRDASGVEALQPVRDALAGTGFRLQLTVPRPDAARWSIVRHDLDPSDDGWFSGYRRQARSVEPAQLIAAAVELLTDPEAGPDDGADDADLAEPTSDVLLCGHGSRDRCCGSMGTALAMAALADGLAIRRTSHTGGHRFAPTGLVLPSGTAWAFLDDDALARIVSESGPLDDLLVRFRGSVWLAGPALQAAERAAFGAVGWSWLRHRRRVVELEAGDDGSRRVLVEAVDPADPAGGVRSWVVEVAVGRRMPVPECGRDPADAPKSETEVVVSSITETTPPPSPSAFRR